VVPGFHCAFHPDMPPSLTPGSSIVVPSRTPTSTLAFAMDQRARHSRCSRNPFRAGHGFRGYTGSLLLRPVRLLAPLYGSDPVSRPPGAFTSRLSTARSSLPSLDMTTAVTGLLCWRGFHPQEWQLASLHWSGRASQEGFLDLSALRSCISRAKRQIMTQYQRQAFYKPIPENHE